MIRKIIRISLLSALAIIGILGIILTAISSDFMGGASVFLFFTVQSNIFIILMALVTIADEVYSLITKKSFINQVIYYLKFVATVSITVTFLVFFTLLAPLMGIDYLLSFNNYSLHAIVPIIAIVDLILFDTGINISYLKSLVGAGMAVYYVAFVYIGVPLKFQYAADLKFPYFFLDYEKNGFFFEKGFGIIPWILVLLLGIFAICLLFCFILKLRQKAISKKNNQSK